MEKNLKFVSIGLAELSNAFFVSIMKQIVALILEFTPEKLGVSEFMVKFKSLVDKLQDYVLRSFTLAETQELNELDKERDDLFTYFNQAFRMGLKSPEESERKAAQALSEVMKPYYNSKTTRLAHEKETVYIDGFIMDVSKPENLAHITTLNLTTKLDQLKKAESDFVVLYKKRTDSRTELYAENTQELRGETEVYYDRILDQIFAKSILEPSEEIHTFMIKWNGSLNETKASINKVAAQYAANKKKDEDPKDKPATGEDPVVTDDKNGVTTAGRPPATETTDPSETVTAQP